MSDLTDDELEDIATFRLEPSPEDVAEIAKELLNYRLGKWIVR